MPESCIVLKMLEMTEDASSYMMAPSRSCSGNDYCLNMEASSGALRQQKEVYQQQLSTEVAKAAIAFKPSVNVQ